MQLKQLVHIDIWSCYLLNSHISSERASGGIGTTICNVRDRKIVWRHCVYLKSLNYLYTSIIPRIAIALTGIRSSKLPPNSWINSRTLQFWGLRSLKWRRVQNCSDVILCKTFSTLSGIDCMIHTESLPGPELISSVLIKNILTCNQAWKLSNLNFYIVPDLRLYCSYNLTSPYCSRIPVKYMIEEK